MPIFLLLAVTALIFLNGATDASNAIAAAVSSGALSMRHAAILSAIGNALGGVCAALFFGRIGESVESAADFGSFGAVGVLASLLATVTFTAIAWRMRLPTSESHALLAAAAGVRAVLDGDGILTAIAPSLLWMTLCTVGGFGAGVLFAHCMPRTMRTRTVRRWQIVSAGAASFFHGVQDLPKFLALLAVAGVSDSRPLWMAAVGVMALGTLLGGRRMTEAVGTELADLTPCGALASDFAAAGTLFLLSMGGVPASTTHAKTAAVAAAALRVDGCSLHKRQLGRFILAWIVTFPVCAALGAAFARGVLFAF
ncbi:MAG: inorganic phosphate transporter [Clostridia bacterium]|nr:inorganic phosphate transporter [Clostridia bacterium]